DTPKQISAQLQSSHGSTQLNLGNLSHPKATAESEGRGEGFELRTDQWGAVRAGEGLLISTHPQAQAEGNHLDASEAKSQIESSLNNTQALSEVAKNQQTDPLEVLENLQSFIETLSNDDPAKADAFKSAIMVLAAPNSIALSSQQDVHLSADGQISHSAGESINLSTQQSLIAHANQKLSLFAAQEGARLYAGKGKVEIQAQGDGADLIARKGVQVISTEDVIDFKSAKEIVLTAGGSQLRITGSGIFPTTGGKFEVKAGQHQFVPGTKVNMNLPFFPQSVCWECLARRASQRGAFVNKGDGS
ncbi:type VI secretion system Vgr family protein, partial [Acinetobacter indicus]|uniref:type VI secretion system Vgr family protein n=1 Tax=Acinetobacter indicus TaxID=756892 RepID=UPI001315987E